MQAHAGVDSDSGLVHSLAGTVAKCHDSTQRENLLHGEEYIIGGDKAYANDSLKNIVAQMVFFMVLMIKQKKHRLSNKQKNVIVNYQVGEQKSNTHFR